MELSANFYVGKVTDPHQIWRFLVKALRKKVLEDTGIFFACRCCGRPHLFHQPVHPTFADGNAMLPCKTEGHLLYAQPFVGLGIDLQDLLPDLHIFLLPAGGLMPQRFVIGAAVDPEFGPKLHISVVDGYARIERLDFEPFNESEDLWRAVAQYRERYG